jgi:hypothetical protein
MANNDFREVSRTNAKLLAVNFPEVPKLLHPNASADARLHYLEYVSNFREVSLHLIILPNRLLGLQWLDYKMNNLTCQNDFAG